MKKLFVMICALCSQLLMAQTVGPLIQTQWDQAAPFNCMIPEKDGQHCLASCGAAAMAQICYYHRWPEHGMGEGHYHVVDEDFIRVDLTKDYYEYDKMLLTYNESSSEEALKATALLIRDVAFLGAVFSLEESFSPSVQGLAMCFGYDKGMLHLDRDYCTDEDFKAVIRAELDAGRPVYMSGSNSSMGHSFVCDGYRDNDEFHFNYGWAGKYDGWATLEDFLFPVSMTIDYNIKKDEGGTPGFTLRSNQDFKWIGANRLYGSYYLFCHVPWGTKRQMALAVENTATHEVQYLYIYQPSSGEEKFEHIWELDADLADGDYILYPVAQDATNNSDWKKSYFRDLCQSEVNLTVKDGVKSFVNAHLYDPVREGAVEAEGLCYELDENAGTASLTYRNDKYASYMGDIVIPETITVGEKTYTVTAIGESAFKECKFLDNLRIAKTITTIGWGAFSQCAINQVTFAEGSQLKTIDDFAFYSDDIKEIVLPEGLVTVGSSAFGNAYIGNLTIPSTLTNWGQVCFETTTLKSVHINSTTPPVIEPCFRMSDNENGFSDFFDIYWASCDISATVLYVPAGTKTAYAQADVWKEFGFTLEPGDDDSFVSQIVRDGITVDGIAYQINGYKGIARAIVIREDMTDVVFKNEIKLGDKTLAVTGLTGNPQGDRLIRKDYNSVVVPASIETLGKGFISEATLGSLTFEEGSHLKTIEDDAITLLTTKSPLVLPEGLKTISGLTLRDADITIPESVTTIENNMFYNLKHVRVAWPTPLAASNLFNKGQFEAGNNIDDATLHVPEGAKDLYAAADGWKLFSKIVEGNDDGLGDVNEDGMVNIADVVMLTNVIIEDSSDLKYDINGDGKVDTNDIIALVNIIAGNAP
ncbi:MAG: C10 family peptidase [Prevotella sp.]|nr:C10 family peptidase [Prevotella sp.]